ncbi:MAG: prolipoprotein diacylglyceryl transferase [Gammaproteobacteria bacterium]|nr:prolipoprotein diacylglyceryl transferase [Gammaproteobacteria bacterium]
MLSYPDIDPVAIQLGPVAVRWYGISYVAAILLAWWLLNWRARTSRPDWSRYRVADLIFYAAVGLIIGGRLGSVLFYNFAYYLDNPLSILKIWEGGMSFHGGLIGVLAAVWLFGRTAGKRFFDSSDFLAPVVPVGLGSGRIGNFINGELWGKPSELPWAMIFPDPRAGAVPRHPSQLYEALLEGLVLFIVLWWFSSRPRPAMAVSGLFLFLYGVFRCGAELVREPDAHIGYLVGGWLTMGQVLSAPMIVAGAILLVLAYRRTGVGIP